MCATSTHRRCPAPGCNQVVASSLAFCRTHWFALPRTLRTEINRSWGGLKLISPSQQPAAYLQARRTHLSLLLSAKEFFTPNHQNQPKESPHA